MPPMPLRLPILLSMLAASTPVNAAAQDRPPRSAYQPVAPGEELLTRGAARIRVLVDSLALGGVEVEVAELTLSPGQAGPPRHHRHGAVELLYILSGTLDHVVNGRPQRLEPGMLGIVRPPDSVAHHVVSTQPVRALVIWAPGGELDRLRPAFDAAVDTTMTAGDRTRAVDVLRAAWTDAYQAGDVAALADLYTADAVRMPYDAPQQVGRDAVLDAYAAGFARRAFDPTIALTPDAIERRADVVLERGRYREILRSRRGPRVLVEEGKYVSLIRRGEDGRWRYAWSMFNRDAPARPLE